MQNLIIELEDADLPEPGEQAEFEKDGFSIVVENTRSVSEEDEESTTAQAGEVVKYVPVEITAPASVVRHAARVFQRDRRTRVERYTLCDRQGGRVVRRRLDREPLTNVTCAQCRRALAVEGLLSK